MKDTPVLSNKDLKFVIRFGYTALFILCIVYIFLSAIASLFTHWWLQLPMQLLAVALPMILARFVPFLHAADRDPEIGLSPRPLLTTIWLLPVFVGTVYVFSCLSGWLADLAGVDTSYAYGDNIWLAILLGAVIPAVCEELFCRFVFLPRLSYYSRSGAIFASAIFFSFMHGNLYQIPYALVAGVLLGALAIGCGSLLPCILFHFVNNLMSILLYFYRDTILPTVLLWVLVCGLAVSLLCAILLRRRLWERLRLVFSCDRTTGYVVAGVFTTPIVIILIFFVFGAILEMFV